MNAKRFAITVTFGLLGLALASLWLLTNQSALAQPMEWTVCPEGPPTCDYTIIQDAVDAAGEGDLVKVARGDYSDVHGRLPPPGYLDPPPGGIITQVVYISKTITIRGGYTTDFTEPPDPEANLTILDAHGEGRVAFVTGNTSPCIEGLQITGGNADGLGGYDWDPGNGVGGGIYVITATATITNNRVLTNTAFRGGGLFLFNSNSTISVSTFKHNTTTDSFGHGAGVYLYGSSPTLTRNTINNNTTYDPFGYGGGIYLDHSSASLNSNTFDSNWGYDGGGVYLYYSEAMLTDNTITNNTTKSWGQGGGLYALYSDAMLDGNAIAANSADEGGGIYLYYSDAEVLGNTLTDNQAANGGGVFLYHSNATVSDNEISSNTAQENGAGLYVHLSDAAAVLSANTVASNDAEGDGGGFYLYGWGPTLDGNTIVGNTADNGAGLYLDNCDAALSRNQISGNVASLAGGGMYLQESNATLNSTTIIANTAIWYGGGLYLTSSAAELTNNVVADSEANIAGSGIYITASSSPQFLHNTIARSTGGDGSGVHVTGDSSVALLNTILVSHTVGINVAAGSAATLQASLWGSGTWANGTDWAGQGIIATGTVNIRDYPVFVDPDTGDYHIGADSAAVDTGVNAGVAIDIDGEARPAGAGYDIGADEYLNLMPQVTSITPNVGQDDGPVHITDLAGNNFQTDATVKLSMTGEPDIVGTNVTVLSAFQITCDFDLAGAAPGAWDVVVTNPGGQSAALPGGFTIVSMRLALAKWAEPDPVQAGQRLTYTLRLTNTGNIDLHATITDILPLHVTPTGILTWTPDPIPADHTWSATVLVAVEVGYAGLLTNVVRVTAEEGLSGIFTCTTSVEEPIVNLMATNDSPTRLGKPTTLTATVTTGSHVTYAWAFGDGEYGQGAVIDHTYAEVDIYTAVVTASNSVSEFTATTTITIVEPSLYTYLPLVLRNAP
jgi:uncharacterized repeat protein (TIGR01451 family)